ncbi:AraC family transcriptional regulator [bacterium]|nr:AraC family transcriptional regulator [bacterium]
MTYQPVTQGTLLRTVKLDGIRLTETVHEQRLQLGPHSHEFFNLTFVLKGSFVESFERNRLELSSNSVLFEPAGVIHSDNFGDRGAHSLIVEPPEHWIQSVNLDSSLLLNPFHLNDPFTSKLVTRIYREFQFPDRFSSLAVQATLLELFSFTFRKIQCRNELKPPWLAKVQNHIEEHFQDALTISSLSKVVDVHPAHLIRSFRKFLSCTPGGYIRRTRLKFAAKLLQETNLSLTEIALSTGFCDQSHFTHSFRRHFGITPRRFRKSNTPNAG